METNADVAIIGGGPAGSVLATLLARRGLDVAIVEREVFPRDKVCGEFLSYDALPLLERVGALQAIDQAGAPHIRRCRVRGRRASLEFDLPAAARGVSRALLDDLLLRGALAAGARAFGGWTATALDPERRQVSLQRGDEALSLTARVLVGAWGRWGRFDQQLGRAFAADRAHRNFGFKRHYRSSSPDDAVIELYSFRRGYLGVSAVEGGLTNICGLVHSSRLAGHKGRWDAFVERIRGEEPQLDALYARHQPAQQEFLSSDPVIFRARSPVERGLVMIGDAAGLIDPLTGNGMAMAVQSAFLAAPYVVRLVEGTGDPDGYRAAHAAFFSSRIRWSRTVARLLSNPSMLESAMTVLPAPSIGSVLVRRTRADTSSIQRLAAQRF